MTPKSITRTLGNQVPVLGKEMPTYGIESNSANKGGMRTDRKGPKTARKRSKVQSSPFQPSYPTATMAKSAQIPGEP